MIRPQFLLPIHHELAVDDLKRITESCTAMVRAFGTTAAQAASALAAFGAGIKPLVKGEMALPLTKKKAKRPWYRRGRW